MKGLAVTRWYCNSERSYTELTNMAAVSLTKIMIPTD